MAAEEVELTVEPEQLDVPPGPLAGMQLMPAPGADTDMGAGDGDEDDLRMGLEEAVDDDLLVDEDVAGDQCGCCLHQEGALNPAVPDPQEGAGMVVEPVPQIMRLPFWMGHCILCFNVWLTCFPWMKWQDTMGYAYAF